MDNRGGSSLANDRGGSISPRISGSSSSGVGTLTRNILVRRILVQDETEFSGEWSHFQKHKLDPKRVRYYVRCI